MNQFFSEYLGISAAAQSKIFISIIVIFVLWLIRRSIVKLIFTRFENEHLKFSWKRYSLYINVFIGLLIISRLWFGAFTELSTYLGLVSAGLAIALQDPLVNIAAWLFITIRKPFKVGDRIQIGDTAGDVIDIRIFQFSLVEIRNWVDADQSTGRIIHVPNNVVFKEPQMNFTAGFEYIWDEIPVLLTFESDWKKAKAILTQVVNNHAEKFSSSAEKQIKAAATKFFIYFNKITPIVYTSVKDSGVMLTIRFLCNVRARRSMEEIMWEEILTEFAKYKNIDFAYPTTRFYNNLSEGKEATKPNNKTN